MKIIIMILGLLILSVDSFASFANFRYQDEADRENRLLNPNDWIQDAVGGRIGFISFPGPIKGNSRDLGDKEISCFVSGAVNSAPITTDFYHIVRVSTRNSDYTARLLLRRDSDNESTFLECSMIPKTDYIFKISDLVKYFNQNEAILITREQDESKYLSITENINL
ncbi:MAG: hypothetical protein KDD50_16175 [Bdellovibrionales bacterium]|nr:hypothetical protein [Bdellovibrionales bacterium]